MNNNAETLARMTLEIVRIVGDYVDEPTSAHAQLAPSNLSCRS